MMHSKIHFVLLVALAACAPSVNSDLDPDVPCTDGDYDNDCISDALEGCALDIDSDNDGKPDWNDTDSDNDGIPDRVEVGDCEDPRDSDGDGDPDYVDIDSDNDGALDRFEDRNGDGIVGTCEQSCASADGCDEGFACSAAIGSSSGVCVNIECLDGETDPRNPDTDGDGTPDGLEGTFVCNPQGEDNPLGLKQILHLDSTDTGLFETADWRVAIELGSVLGAPLIGDKDPLDSIQFFDQPSGNGSVAGFLVTAVMPDIVPSTNVSTAAISRLAGHPELLSVVPRISGTKRQSLDGHDTVVSTTVELVTRTPMDLDAARILVVTALSDRPETDLTFPDATWALDEGTEFVLMFQTLIREQGQQLFMGGMTPKNAFDNRANPARMHLDDLANGTGLAHSMNGEVVECEQFLADKIPMADIIWIVDGSGSISDDRQRIGGHANSFFEKANDAGLDFRVGVTDMTLARDGLFSSRDTGGTGDRWMSSAEPGAFAIAINDPSGPDLSDGGLEFGLEQGSAAIARHLPRDDSDPQRFREDAEIVIIYVSDEHPQSLESTNWGNILLNNNDIPTQMQLDAIASYVGPYADDLISVNGTAHGILVSLPHSAAGCFGGEVGYGYFDVINATGGQVGNLCQEDLGSTIDTMIDSVLAKSSPVSLPHVPISATIGVARDDIAVPRSMSEGWSYHASSNSIVFHGMPFDPNNPADVVVSYRRWASQAPIE